MAEFIVGKSYRLIDDTYPGDTKILKDRYYKLLKIRNDSRVEVYDDRGTQKCLFTNRFDVNDCLEDKATKDQTMNKEFIVGKSYLLINANDVGIYTFTKGNYYKFKKLIGGRALVDDDNGSKAEIYILRFNVNDCLEDKAMNKEFVVGKSYKALGPNRNFISGDVTVGSYYKVKEVFPSTLIIVSNDGTTSTYDKVKFDVNDSKEDTVIKTNAQFEIGRCYKCIKELSGAFTVGKYYEVTQVNLLPDGTVKTLVVKTDRKDSGSFTTQWFDVNDSVNATIEQQENAEMKKEFIVGKSYRAKVGNLDYGVIFGFYYKVVQFFQATNEVKIVRPDGRELTFNIGYFDVNDRLEDINEKVNTVTDRPVINSKFAVTLNRAVEKEKVYDTPGLYEFNSLENGNTTYVILAVSYDPLNNLLSGFVVDKGNSIFDDKHWSSSWNAKLFRRIAGQLVLDFEI